MPPITTNQQKQQHNPSPYPNLNPSRNPTMKIKIPALPPPPPLRPPPPEPGWEWEARARARKPALLRPHTRTNPLVWCGAILCAIFSLVLILAGILTLIVFLAIKPRHPLFDTASASLNSIYLDTPAYLNGDFTFLANFSNPNGKVDFIFEYLSIELYFYNRLIATQGLQPFAQRRGEARLEAVHLLSSQVFLPPDLVVELRKQVMNNRVVYNIRGTFRVKASLGFGHVSYWLYGRCLVELTGPPTGVLMARNCRTKR